MQPASVTWLGAELEARPEPIAVAFSGQKEAEGTGPDASMRKQVITLTVTNPSGSVDPRQVHRALTAVEGVDRVEVSAVSSCALVTGDGAVHADELINVLAAWGYLATVTDIRKWHRRED